MKNKIKTIRKSLEAIYKLDDKAYNLLNEKVYDKYTGPIFMAVEDLVFLALFNKDYDEVFNSFSTPGNPQKGKPVLWDNGYPPEQLMDLLKNPTSSDKEVLATIKLIKDGLKKR